MTRPAALLAALALLAAPLVGQSPALQSPALQSPAPSAASGAPAADQGKGGASLAERLQAAYTKAYAHAKAKRFDEAMKLLDAILKKDPTLTSSRLLRAQVRYQLKQYAEAEEDCAQVVREAPSLARGAALLAKIREKLTPVTVTVVGGAAKYSEWQWAWELDATKPFAFGDYKGAEGHTLYYWPAEPLKKASWEALEAEASNDRLYFLRVVALKHPTGVADLTLPGAMDHKVTETPYMVLIDETGAVVARGKPAEVQPKLDAVKKAKRDAGKTVEVLSTTDVSAADQALGTFAMTGWTTIVMMTSKACHDCQAIKPKIEQIPANHAKVRVVMADIGVDEAGKINWTSPFYGARGVHGVPWFFVLDGAGAVTSNGNDKSDVLKPYLGE